MTLRPTFTIVLCTRDRAALLGSALESLLGIDYPADDFELVLIDNGSSDGTKRVADRFAERAPFALRYFYEARAGLSVARNRAIQEARGEYLFFTDDDQLVDEKVLREHERVARTYRSRVQQGCIELRFPRGQPSWLRGELTTVLGKTRDLPEGPQDIDLYGGNMLLKREVFADFDAFREDLGKGAAGYSEDIEITRRLLKGRETVVYAPGARIYHLIEPDRADPSFFRRNAFEKGYSDGLICESSHALAREALRTVGRLARGGPAVLTGLVRRDRYLAVLAQTQMANQIGRFVGVARKRWLGA